VFENPAARAFSDSSLPGIESQRLHELGFPELAGHQGFVSVPDSVRSIRFSEAANTLPAGIFHEAAPLEF
jgi:hypothetical protein